MRESIQKLGAELRNGSLLNRVLFGVIWFFGVCLVFFGNSLDILGKYNQMDSLEETFSIISNRQIDKVIDNTSTEKGNCCQKQTKRGFV